MLYERWQRIVREFSEELALVEFATNRRWTFAQLNEEAGRAEKCRGRYVHPQGTGADFIFEVLRAWRDGSVVVPTESGQPWREFSDVPPRCAHIKTTSATSGDAKAIAFTAEQIAADAEQIVHTMGLRPGRPNLSVISMAHSFGFSNLVTPLLLHGVPLVLLEAPLPDLVRRSAETFGPVSLPAVPALWKLWHESGVLSDRITIAISAGAPLGIELEKAVFERSGVKLHNFYGASECGGIAYDDSVIPRSDPRVVGRPMSGVQLSVHSSGVLEVKSSAVGIGYWPSPAEELQGGVYRTSDLAEMSDGKVFLLGRVGDVINLAGRKLAPETVERVLQAHPAVRSCVVFGVPSEESRTEKVVACVNATAVTALQLRDHLLRHLSAWQVPKDFWMTQDLAVNGRGKISRAEWRKRFLNRAVTSP